MHREGREPYEERFVGQDVEAASFPWPGTSTAPSTAAKNAWVNAEAMVVFDVGGGAQAPAKRRVSPVA